MGDSLTGDYGSVLLRHASNYCHRAGSGGRPADSHAQHEYTGGVCALDQIRPWSLAEGAVLDDAARKKAADQEITVLSTDMPVFGSGP